MSEEQEFYTASEARKVLGLTEATFFDRVKKGHIPKVIPPGKRQGLYPKRTIDALAQAMHIHPALSEVVQNAIGNLRPA